MFSFKTKVYDIKVFLFNFSWTSSLKHFLSKASPIFTARKLADRFVRLFSVKDDCVFIQID